ncbi:FAD-dependent oxidoreductase [Streptomyces sp. DSM 118878]
MAGLTAAMELAERGFEVTVAEPVGWGGKARSAWVAGTGRGGRLDLPSEYGFRFFPGVYRSLPDTLRRIPVDGSTEGTAVGGPGAQRPHHHSLDRPVDPSSGVPGGAAGTRMGGRAAGPERSPCHRGPHA